MGNQPSCDHRDVEVKDIEEKIYLTKGQFLSLFGDNEWQFGTMCCVDCPKKWRVIRHRKVNGDWGSWATIDTKFCSHEDGFLEVLTDKISHRRVNTTPAILFLAGPGWQSHSNIPIAHVKCVKCETMFSNAAEQKSTERWEKQKVVRDSSWVIDHKKINNNNTRL